MITLGISNELLELIINQAENVISTMKELKRIAHKQGKDRAKLIEKYKANEHSFKVYTYANAELNESEKVNVFKQTLARFTELFEKAQYEFEEEINLSQVEDKYEETLHAYNEMVAALGFDKEQVNIKRF